MSTIFTYAVKLTPRAHQGGCGPTNASTFTCAVQRQGGALGRALIHFVTQLKCEKERKDGDISAEACDLLKDERRSWAQSKQ